jgi:hypothetical protein
LSIVYLLSIHLGVDAKVIKTCIVLNELKNNLIIKWNFKIINGTEA